MLCTSQLEVRPLGEAMKLSKGQAVVSRVAIEVPAVLTGTWTAPSGTNGYIKEVNSSSYTVVFDYKGVERKVTGVKEDQVKKR